MDAVRFRAGAWLAVGMVMALFATLVIVVGQQFVWATKSSGERPVFIAVTPCRMLDTRAGVNNVGPRSTPIGAGETSTVNGRGPSGNCTAATIPADATALTLNVTAVGATQQTNLRVFPAGAPLPTVSNLNPSPGAPPAPNAVTTDLSASGQFNVYNAAGAVNVIVDVAGYFVDHDHDDRYYTKAQTDDSYLHADDIVMTQTGVDLVPDFSSPPTKVGAGTNGGTTSADGEVWIPLIGPYVIGSVGYRLSSVRYCVGFLDPGVFIGEAAVYFPNESESQGFTPITGLGCQTVVITSGTLRSTQHIGFKVLADVNGATKRLTFTTLTTTWTPVPALS